METLYYSYDNCSCMSHCFVRLRGMQKRAPLHGAAGELEEIHGAQYALYPLMPPALLLGLGCRV